MLGVDHDPGQARGIEQAFVEVEVPGPGLLGQQAPLQAVGEAADHALETAELLVELGAQTGELERAAQLARLDHLVELGREHAVGQRLAARRQVLRRLEGRLAVAVLVGALALARPAILARAGLGALVGARAGVGFARPARRPRGAVARARRRWRAAPPRSPRSVGLLVLRLLAEILGQAEMGQHLAHLDGEVLLGGQQLAHAAPVLAGAAVERLRQGSSDLALLARQVKPSRLSRA